MARLSSVLLSSVLGFMTFQAFAQPSSECRFGSDFDCRHRSIGDRCGRAGTCFAHDWTFDEPDCKCYEEPDRKMNYCSWRSDPECRDRLPGRHHHGYCKVVSVHFDEPTCERAHH